MLSNVSKIKGKDEIKYMPRSMMEKALRARELARNQFVQFDPWLLPWVYDEENRVWLSFNGNYSDVSPEEKMLKYEERLREDEVIHKMAMEEVKQAFFEAEVRMRVLERDNNTCQLCGKTKPNKLAVHHIIKRREGGEYIPDNLITLCSKCHGGADSKKQYDPDWI